MIGKWPVSADIYIYRLNRIIVQVLLYMHSSVQVAIGESFYFYVRSLSKFVPLRLTISIQNSSNNILYYIILNNVPFIDHKDVTLMCITAHQQYKLITLVHTELLTQPYNKKLRVPTQS